MITIKIQKLRQPPGQSLLTFVLPSRPSKEELKLRATACSDLLGGRLLICQKYSPTVSSTEGKRQAALFEEFCVVLRKTVEVADKYWEGLGIDPMVTNPDLTLTYAGYTARNIHHNPKTKTGRMQQHIDGGTTVPSMAARHFRSSFSRRETWLSVSLPSVG